MKKHLSKIKIISYLAYLIWQIARSKKISKKFQKINQWNKLKFSSASQPFLTPEVLKYFYGTLGPYIV